MKVSAEAVVVTPFGSVTVTELIAPEPIFDGSVITAFAPFNVTSVPTIPDVGAFVGADIVGTTDVA